MNIDHCDFPDDLLYDLSNNVWVRSEAGVFRIGITSVHSALAGRLNTIRVKPTGTKLSRDQSVATIESVKYFGVVRTPLSGTVVAVNPRLEREPKLANDFPYSEGWFAEVAREASDVSASLTEAKECVEQIKGQIRELRVRCFAAYPDYEMWEIGVECAAVLIRLNELVDRSGLGEIIHVISDDPTADIEMVRWVDQTGQEVLESRKERNLMHFIVKKVR